MAITATQKNGSERIQMATGNHLDDAGSPAAADILVGFTPRYVQVVDETTGVMLEWFDGMTSGHAIKTVAAGARTAETSGGITVNGRKIGFTVVQNSQYRWKAVS